jgi:AmmeMemoRadiSam system protein B
MPSAEKAAALGCIVPHAGYIYSGHVAGAVFSRLDIPPQAILMCPNHTGRGTPLSIMSEGTWKTPLGAMHIDSNLAEHLKRQFEFLEEDAEAHRSEHAAEVELPFLQVLRPEAKFVPIAVGTRQFEVLEALGLAVAEVITAAGGNILMIASSDMNHYESDAVTRAKDHKAVEKILEIDPLGLYEAVLAENISMCGLGPAIVMLTAAKQLRATSAELVKYATSGDVSGDRDLVVGYAGVVIR